MTSNHQKINWRTRKTQLMLPLTTLVHVKHYSKFGVRLHNFQGKDFLTEIKQCQIDEALEQAWVGLVTNFLCNLCGWVEDENSFWDFFAFMRFGMLFTKWKCFFRQLLKAFYVNMSLHVLSIPLFILILPNSFSYRFYSIILYARRK